LKAGSREWEKTAFIFDYETCFILTAPCLIFRINIHADLLKPNPLIIIVVN